jgi:SWI/SNF-related matrix-associated actin-dependent regulator of chromatin subfamily A3
MKVASPNAENFINQCTRANTYAAHIIRRTKTTFYKAVSELKSRSRWCLTGTPIQNRLEEVGALFAFIRARPFHSLAVFRRFVVIPFEESMERRAVAIRNLTLLLDSLCLRRSRDLLHLPEPQEIVRFIEFSKEEQEQYEQTKKAMNRALRQRAGEAYSQSKNIFGMFQVQLQLRILCNHGTYQHPFSWTRRSLLDEREDALCLIGGSGEVNCSVCREPMPILGSKQSYRTYPGICAHAICSECLDEDETASGEGNHEILKCPLCVITGAPAALASGGIQSGGTTDDQHGSYLRPKGHSSKMSSLICDVREDLWKTKR